MRAYAWVLVVVVVGCSAPAELLVDLRTDFTPHYEFDRVHTELLPGPLGSSTSGPAVDHAVECTLADGRSECGEYFAPPRRVAEIRTTPMSVAVLRVTLSREGEEIGSTVALVAVRAGASQVLIQFPRECLGLDCPTGQACVRGQCADLTCLDRNGPECPPVVCARDVECAVGGAECVEGRCSGGTCFAIPRSDACGFGRYCDVGRGCLDDPATALDGGMPGPDAGPPDAGPVSIPDACVAVTETCNGADEDCDGRVDEDFAFATDRNNCGRCGIVCPAVSSCIDGRCQVVCAAGSSDCDGNGTCEDLTATSSCGACGNACRDNEECVSNATGASCVCRAPFVSCDGECIPVQDDRLNCGGCGMACGPNAECCAGVCRRTGSATNCDGACMRCGAGEVCGTMGTCVPSSGCVPGCGIGELCCGGTCVPDDADPNCGSCGMDCPGVTTCESGTCVCSCPGGGCCGAACRDLFEDENNCGRCGARCGALEECVGGQCVCGVDAASPGDGPACTSGDSCCLGCTVLGEAQCLDDCTFCN